MAFRKTGSRRITVDGVAYRWRFPHRPSAGSWDGNSGCRVTVQRADGVGCVLTIRYADQHPTIAALWGNPILAVRPAHVADAIRRALAAGWRPDEPGVGFTVEGEADRSAR